MVTTNLSTRPFYNERAVRAMLLGLLAVTLVLAIATYGARRLLGRAELVVLGHEDQLRAVVGAARAGVDGHREYHTGWHAALDLRNLLTVSEAIARSALERRESRGGHFRDDYPDKSPEFATFNIAVRQNGTGAMDVVRRPIPEMPSDLKQVIEDQKQ